MANSIYTLAKKAFLDGQIDLLSNDIKALLIDSAGYSVNLTTDEFLSDIPAGARIATSANLTGKSTTAGVFDADDTVFSSVTGVQSEAIVIYQDTGVEATSRLILYASSYSGLPITPNGADINMVWDNGANKIFRI